jgi:predicted ArsR family transcriptional regulator
VGYIISTAVVTGEIPLENHRSTVGGRRRKAETRTILSVLLSEGAGMDEMSTRLRVSSHEVRKYLREMRRDGLIG